MSILEMLPPAAPNQVMYELAKSITSVLHMALSAWVCGYMIR